MEKDGGVWCVEHIFEKSAARKGFVISTYYVSKIATALKCFSFFEMISRNIFRFRLRSSLSQYR